MFGLLAGVGLLHAPGLFGFTLFLQTGMFSLETQLLGFEFGCMVFVVNLFRIQVELTGTLGLCYSLCIWAWCGSGCVVVIFCDVIMFGVCERSGFGFRVCFVVIGFVVLRGWFVCLGVLLVSLVEWVD